MTELYKRLEDQGRIVLMVPKTVLTNEEKTSLRNQPKLLVGQTHDHFLISTEEEATESEPAPLPPTKPTDPNSPEALLNPSNPEGQYRSPEEPMSGPELEAMTVAQLKEYAVENDVDLSGCKTKADMVARIREAEADVHDEDAKQQDADERARIEGEQL
ncbi:hypothetical protein SEA_GIBSON_10 [Streptomyces phage Gibson]|nr:hypothetical protein SEA_GIBSON_10 [Streptomyces phage Gibson]